MVPRRLALAPTLISFLLLAPPVGAEYFSIDTFDAAVLVGEDGDVQVSEEITVDFASPRHGIYRDIPFRFTDDLGRRVRTPVDVIAVTDGKGRKRPYGITRAGDAVRVRIGHPRRYVEGRQVYVIAYRIGGAVLRLPDRDELAWNVNGTGWDAPVRLVTATVTLPAAAGENILGFDCYTGRRGSTERSCRAEKWAVSVSFTSTRGLAPRENMTVAVGWESGIVGDPPLLRRFLRRVNAGENWVFLVTLAGAALLSAHWWYAGRDPASGPVTVMYGPPEHGGAGLSPAEVGGVVDERFDPRDLTAAVIGLAVKGHLSIEERETKGVLFKGKDYFLRRQSPESHALPPFERKLLGDLFPGGAPGVLVSDLKDRFYVHIEDLRNILFDGLVGKGYFRSRPGEVRNRYRGFAFVGLLAGGILGYLLVNVFPATMPVKNLAAFLLPGALLLLLARHMPVKTRKGARAAAKVRGFEEFLSRAEKDRLERMQDLTLFEKFLPYAVALGLSDRWAGAFEGIEQSPPSWYRGSSGWRGGFSPTAFNSSLGSALSSMGSNMYAAPRSSGGSGSFSGGGGFSGGGFGGGGGGSW